MLPGDAPGLTTPALVRLASTVPLPARVPPWTLIVLPVSTSIHSTPANAPGTASRMMNGSSHDWKLATISR